MSIICLEGTWQFMSAKLVSNMGGQHDFKDDLESSLYVLLWVTLVYSECSNSEQVPSFLAGVLDPRPHGPNRSGGFAKADFLKGRTFLSEVNFPNRPTLLNLIKQLTVMFAITYETAPESSERRKAESHLEKSKTTEDAEARLHETIYYDSIPYKYDQRMALLNDHTHAIKLFDDALADRSCWPLNDRAVKQPYIAKAPSPERVMKTGWSTTLILMDMAGDDSGKAVPSEDEMEQDDEVEQGDEYQMVDFETFSENTDSDQIFVDGQSPTLFPEDLISKEPPALPMVAAGSTSEC
jgi:hypothetical protein